MAPRWAAVGLALFTTACGAKTGLRVPDVLDERAPDVPEASDAPDVPDLPDLPDTCRAVPQPVDRLTSEVLFVIDRSASMSDRTESGATRWGALTAALGQVLPAVDRELWTGLVVFPAVPRGGTTACGVGREVDLPPRPQQASALLATLRAAATGGGTPTFDALQVAARHYQNTPPTGRVRGRFLVLATDGGPNCNAGLSINTCTCTNPRGCSGLSANTSCLDDVRTLGALRTLVSQGVQTFVIGIPSGDLAFLDNTLNAMAIAGGRPREGTPRYYRAEDSDAFTRVFREITGSLVRCRYVTNPVPDPGRVSVWIGGQRVPRDPTRLTGWDWHRVEAGEFVLYGDACQAAQRDGARVTTRYDCPDEDAR
ncbi:MAG: VWA domain-containing protein [Deltaproteobacteria bacterium]|nr:VWA domain-containing protein [Deltaproteobacteria bacterium]